MPRIVYLLFSNGGIRGGHKMIVRHVETLRDLGFDAVCYIGAGSKPPTWLDHRAPLELATPARADDIIVCPDDALDALRLCAGSSLRTVVFCQSIYAFAGGGMAEVDRFPGSRFPPFIAVGPRVGETLHRSYPGASIDIVPCFVDERRFRPGQTKQAGVAHTPHKRPTESAAIRGLLGKFHPHHRDLPWRPLVGMTETQAAETFAEATLCLSLNRLESVGLTTLEAMASGCVCAGFTGVGGDEYATPDNGFWVTNEYCEAAADALAQAADLANSGGARLRRLQDAGYETAGQWSYARFRAALEATWMRLGPDARLRDGPLDPP